MKYYIITDTHFNHKKLIEYGRQENFEELIWKGLKELPQDCTLIHLGDICIGNDLEVHSKLNYTLSNTIKRILVKGNHDNKSNTWYLEHGWDFVCKSMSDHFYGQYITFSHEPIKGVKNINIHGHFHDDEHRKRESDSYYKPSLHKLLAIERTNYYPVSLEKFLSKL
ncbi:MAG: hypothetical protein [Siphoviridae sp. cttb18]|nr:MAG: hypothetical protein [Siphoviridae sp. cttb18]